MLYCFFSLTLNLLKDTHNWFKKKTQHFWLTAPAIISKQHNAGDEGGLTTRFSSWSWHCSTVSFWWREGDRPQPSLQRRRVTPGSETGPNCVQRVQMLEMSTNPANQHWSRLQSLISEKGQNILSRYEVLPPGSKRWSLTPQKFQGCSLHRPAVTTWHLNSTYWWTWTVLFIQSLANVSLRTDINRSLLSSDIYPESPCVQRALRRRALGQQRVHLLVCAMREFRWVRSVFTHCFALMQKFPMTLGASTLGLLGMVPPGTWMYKCLADILVLNLLDECPEVELLHHMAVSFLTSCGISILFFIVLAPFYIPTNSV